MAHQSNMRNKTINLKGYRKAMEKATSFRGEKKRVLRTCQHSFRGSVATFRFCRKTPRFRDFAEKPIVDCEALRQGGFRAKPGFSEESNLCNTSLLLAFQVQRNNVLNFCAGFSIGKQAKSLASVAKRYRPVARIWAVDGRRFHVKQYCAPVRLL
jgi:hypothetical protein